MLLLLRLRSPRLANILGALSGIVSLAIAVACHASLSVYILGGGSSLALAAARYMGRRRQLTHPSTPVR